MTSLSSKSLLRLQPTPAWMAIIGLFLFIALFLVAGAGRFLVPLFPLGSGLVGIYLYLRKPMLYVGFTWWLWFVGPFIRRVIDFQIGTNTFGPWDLTPHLVTFISVVTLFRHLRQRHKQDSLPFLLCCGSIFYAFLIGAILNESDRAIVGLLTWLGPVLFGFHLFISWREYPGYRQTIRRTFIWGVLLMSLYGLWQFWVAPPWDGLWLTFVAPTGDVASASYGVPVQFGLRVWATMTEPGRFASVLMSGLLIFACDRWSPLVVSATAVGYVAFMLTLVRTAWLGWIAGMLILIASMKLKQQVRILIGILCIAGLVIPVILSTEQLFQVVSARFESFSNIQGDTSYNVRQDAYIRTLSIALMQLLGKGLGGNLGGGLGPGVTLFVNDSTIIPLFSYFGWVGTVPFICGLLLLLFRLFSLAKTQLDSFSQAASAITVGMLVHTGFNNIFEAAQGMVFWSFLGIGLASRKYYLHQRIADSMINSQRDSLL